MPGDVLFSKLRPYLAKSLLVTERLQGSGEFLCLRPQADTDPRFLTYLTLSRPWLDHAVLTSYGTKMPRTSWEQIADLRIPLPALEEQRRIAHFLDDQVARIDQIIAARNSQLRAIREARLTSLDDVVRDAGPPQRLAWCLRLGAVGVVVNPSSYFQEEGVPFVHGYNVRDGYFNFADLKKMSESDSVALGRSRLRANDVLVVRAGYPGRAAVVPPELEGGNCASVLLLRPGPNLSSHWLAAFMNAPIGRGQVEQAQYGAAQGVINLSDVLSFRIPLPERCEQERRLAHLRDVQSQLQSGRELIEKQIQRMVEHKHSLITAAVTGELDVTTAGSGIPG